MKAMMRIAALCAAFASVPQAAVAQVAYYDYWWEVHTWTVQPYVYYAPPPVYYAPPVYVSTCWVENWWNGWCWQLRQICQ